MVNQKGDSVKQEAIKDLIVQNELGLHARPAAMFVKVANGFKSEIFLEKDGERVNGKSIMGVMMLAASKGTKLKLIAQGADAGSAIGALADLFSKKFCEA
ncbi:MAG: HPr family phosphocarrier protein [Chlamydiae bacterium]|nr:HPr family phosphocarrier protein [Chlamydiota bacterium]MBI3277641.1 HPr family phosphocarrier protein [Chlamydiota bacterium]